MSKSNPSPDAYCARHAENKAALMCERCGDFACSECVTALFDRRVCQGCVERYQIDALGDFKKRLWGKRDAYVWFFGGLGSFFSGLSALMAPIAIFTVLSQSGPATGEDYQMLVMGGLLTICFGATLPYFLLQKWARKALFILPVAIMLLTVASVYTEFYFAIESVMSLCCIGIVPFALVLFAYLSERNEFAFKIETDDLAAERLFVSSGGNPEARHSVWLSFLGLFIPPLLLFSLILAVLGYLNCDSEAWPPIGGQGRAKLSFILSVLGLLAWGFFFAQGFTR